MNTKTVDMSLEAAGEAVEARKNFEDAFARMAGAPHARAFKMGRNALYVVLKALGLGPGMTVGICAYTNWSVVEPLLRLGVNIRWLDVDRNLCIDPEDLSKLKPGALDALVLQYTFGFPGQLGRLMGEAKRLRVPVIEDCCHALGTRYDGRHVGSLGVAGIYSFRWGKPLPMGMGGMLTVNDGQLLKRVDGVLTKEGVEMPLKEDARLMLQRAVFGFYYSMPPVLRRLFIGTDSVNPSWPLKREEISDKYAALAGRLQSRAGMARLAKWPALMALRRKNAATIRSFLQGSGMRPWYSAGEECEVVPLRYPFYVLDKQGVLDSARKRRLSVGGWFGMAMGEYPGGKEKIPALNKGECKKAERALREVIHLPTDGSFEERHLDFLSEIKGHILEHP